MAIRDHLEAVYSQYGRLTPALVVEVARDPDHPLHSHVFDVPPDQAAERYYLDRARRLIQIGKVSYKNPETGHEGWVRAFVSVPSEGPDRFVYEPSEKVAQDPKLRMLVLREMERDWRALLQRYEAFEEFATLVADYVSGNNKK